MISVDTNIIIRFLTQDDNVQYKKAFSIFESSDVFIPDTVILETEWVLRFAYEFSPEDICAAFNKLFGLKNVHLMSAVHIAQAIDWHKNGLDFADALHLAHSQYHEKMYTFDKRFSTKSKGLTNCSVITP